MKTEHIKEDEFYERFEPLKNHIEKNASFDGCMYETYDEEYEYIVDQHCNNKNVQVWTIVTGEDDSMFYETGIRRVNRVGFLITNKVPDHSIIVTLDTEMFDEEGSEE